MPFADEEEESVLDVDQMIVRTEGDIYARGDGLCMYF